MKMRLAEMHAPLVLIVGATAVGKTEASIMLAERLDGEIVSADSRLLYRGMDIGTAKPSRAERGNVPHHLIDVADPDEVWSLALFQQAARQAIAAIHARSRLPIMVGGTGQFVRAVVEGWQPPSQQPDDRMREVLTRWAENIGADGLHRRLAVLDPEAAEVIDPPNLRRTVRALEVIFHSGRRFSSQRRRAGSPYSLLKIGLRRPRRELYSRIDTRIDTMLATGFIEEVKTLLASGYALDLPTLSAIGYGELAAHLQGRMSLEEAVCQIKRRTRSFVRRQANWFKESDPSIHWFGAAASNVVDGIEWLICSGEAWLPAAEI